MRRFARKHGVPMQRLFRRGLRAQDGIAGRQRARIAERLERAVILCGENGVLEPEHLGIIRVDAPSSPISPVAPVATAPVSPQPIPAASPGNSPAPTLVEFGSGGHILAVLEGCKGNRAQAAGKFSISAFGPSATNSTNTPDPDLRTRRSDGSRNNQLPGLKGSERPPGRSSACHVQKHTCDVGWHADGSRHPPSYQGARYAGSKQSRSAARRRWVGGYKMILLTPSARRSKRTRLTCRRSAPSSWPPGISTKAELAYGEPVTEIRSAGPKKRLRPAGHEHAWTPVHRRPLFRHHRQPGPAQRQHSCAVVTSENRSRGPRGR